MTNKYYKKHHKNPQRKCFKMSVIILMPLYLPLHTLLCCTNITRRAMLTLPWFRLGWCMQHVDTVQTLHLRQLACLARGWKQPTNPSSCQDPSKTETYEIGCCCVLACCLRLLILSTYQNNKCISIAFIIYAWFFCNCTRSQKQIKHASPHMCTVQLWGFNSGS